MAILIVCIIVGYLLEVIDDEFVKYLFELIEEGDSDPDDPYNYAVVRLLVSIAEYPSYQIRPIHLIS